MAIGTLLYSAAILIAAEVKELRTEYRTNPLGIDASSPRLSWIIDSDRRGEIADGLSGSGGIQSRVPRGRQE